MNFSLNKTQFRNHALLAFRFRKDRREQSNAQRYTQFVRHGRNVSAEMIVINQREIFD